MREDKGAQIGGVLRHLAGKAVRALPKRRRPRVQVHEHEVAEHLHLHGGEEDPVRIEVLDQLRLAGPVQAAAEIVDPGVVRTGDERRRAGALQQLVSAVLADIVEGAQHAVPAADRDDAPVLDAGGPVAARLAQHLLVAQILPAPAEDLLALGFEISRVDVAVRTDGGGSCGDRVVAVARMLQLLSRQAHRHADSHGPEVRGAAPIMPCPIRNTEEPRRNCARRRVAISRGMTHHFGGWDDRARIIECPYRSITFEA